MRIKKNVIQSVFLLGCAMLLSGCGKQEEATTTEEVYVPVTYESMEQTLLAEMEQELAEKETFSSGNADETDTTEQLVTDVTEADTSASEDSTTETSAVKDSIEFWYEDVNDLEYIKAAALAFEERYGIHVDYILHEDADILAAINDANAVGTGPDAYMLSNDLLQKARLSGLVDKNAYYDEQFWADNFPQAAKNALSSGIGVYGYPVYLDTYFMLYDQDLAGEPVTIENVLEFSEKFVDDENKKEIFKWDISDPFYNFMFLGGYASLLGASGEDVSQFDVTNEYVVESMTYFQSMHEILSMEIEDSSYAKIKNKIKKHKLIYAICKTDILPILASTENSYKLSKLPKLTETLDSGSLSITYAACVNPYADSLSAANLFSIFLSYEYSQEMFALNRKIATRSSITRTDENDILIYEQYTQSNTIPKALEMGDFWTYSELAFSKIWEGEDVKTELTNLQELIRQRLN